MAQNPCYGIHLGYDPVLSPDKVLNSDEAKAFFEACDEIGGNADLLQFIFLTYERPGEASTLRFSDWNKSDKTLKINRTKTVDKDGKVIVGSEGKTKTKSSRRTIKLNSASNDILIKRYNERWRSLGKRPGSAYIWVQRNDHGGASAAVTNGQRSDCAAIHAARKRAFTPRRPGAMETDYCSSRRSPSSRILRAALWLRSRRSPQYGQVNMASTGSLPTLRPQAEQICELG